MTFEFDPAKSAANKEKHGIDFVDAQELWLDPYHLVVTARASTEQRWMIVGRHGDKTWSAIFTCRGGAIRIISVRRARPEEEARYLEP